MQRLERRRGVAGRAELRGAPQRGGLAREVADGPRVEARERRRRRGLREALAGVVDVARVAAERRDGIRRRVRGRCAGRPPRARSTACSSSPRSRRATAAGRELGGSAPPHEASITASSGAMRDSRTRPAYDAAGRPRAPLSSRAMAKTDDDPIRELLASLTPALFMGNPTGTVVDHGEQGRRRRRRSRRGARMGPRARRLPGQVLRRRAPGAVAGRRSSPARRRSRTTSFPRTS